MYIHTVQMYLKKYNLGWRLKYLDMTQHMATQMHLMIGHSMRWDKTRC